MLRPPFRAARANASRSLRSRIAQSRPACAERPCRLSRDTSRRQPGVALRHCWRCLLSARRGGCLADSATWRAEGRRHRSRRQRPHLLTAKVRRSPLDLLRRAPHKQRPLAVGEQLVPRSSIERYTDRNTAEGVGFEPTDSLLSSAFKALALGHYANPPERGDQGRRSAAILTEPPRAAASGPCPAA